MRQPWQEMRSVSVAALSERDQAWRRGQVPAGGMPSHSWHIQVIFSSINMLAGIVSRAAKAAGKYFHSVLLKSKPCLTFSCPYAALTYGCSSISTASPATPALWQKEAILPQGACRGTSAHIMVLETAGLAQSSLGSRAAGRWLAPAKATQL